MTSRPPLLCALLLLACTSTPGPSRLQAGVGTRRLDLPVGVALGGYSRTKALDEPGSNWAHQLPASRGVHVEPTARAVALTDGVTRVALVRLDVALTSPTLRSRLLAGLEAAGEHTKLILQSTHTHAGPARMLPPANLGSATGTDFVSLVMDSEDPEVEDRMAKAAVAAVLDAFAGLKPVSLGVASIDAADFNRDRRCENDPLYGPGFRDTALTVLRFDEVDAQGTPVRPLTALLHYAMHGTVLSSENTLQSTEAPGALELASADALGIPVMYLQGAAGDVSPAGSPAGHDALQDLEVQGHTEAELAVEAWQRAAPGPAPKTVRLELLERGVEVSRAAIGYAPGEFPEGGGIQCLAGGDGACGAVESDPKDVVCFPLAVRRPFKTLLTLLRLGDVQFLSLPGEPGTGLSRKLMAALGPLGAGTTLPLGYAQDHYGYLLETDDWLRGGYEPTISPWGWKFGPYLLSQVETFVGTVDAGQPAADVMPFTQDYTPRAIVDATGAPQTVTQPQDGERLTTHVFAFEGGDPSLGTPQVALEQEDGGTFVPVQASATRRVINGPELLLRYDATPTWKAEPTATARRHLWTVQFETVPTTPLGTYRLVADGTAQVAGVSAAYHLVSRGFTVTPSTDVGGPGLLPATVTSDHRLAVTVTFSPNPTLFAPGQQDVIGHYRARDRVSNPAMGARVSGTTARATLSTPAGTSRPLTLTWSASAQAWLTEPLPEVGPVTLTFAAGAIVDPSGNTHAGALTTAAALP
jgi:hypothetical protein